MNYELRFSAASQRDLRSIVRYLASRFGFQAAQGFRDKLVAECESLQIAPYRGELQPRLGAGVRKIGYDHRTTILFEVDETTQRVSIVRVLHRGRTR